MQFNVRLTSGYLSQQPQQQKLTTDLKYTNKCCNKRQNQEESNVNERNDGEKNEWNFVRTFGLLNSDSFHLIHLAARGDMDASTILLVFFVL